MFVFGVCGEFVVVFLLEFLEFFWFCDFRFFVGFDDYGFYFFVFKDCIKIIFFVGFFGVVNYVCYFVEFFISWVDYCYVCCWIFFLEFFGNFVVVFVLEVVCVFNFDFFVVDVEVNGFFVFFFDY